MFIFVPYNALMLPTMLKYRRVIQIFLLLLTCCLFSSCFDLVEEVDLKSNGSGTIKATLNLSKSKTKVASLMKLKSINGITIPSQTTITAETNSIVKLLKATPGISQVQHSLDFNNFVATVSCNFESIEALNSFSQTLAKHFKSPLGKNNSYSFNKATQVLTRSYKHSPTFNKEFAKMSESDRKLFADAFYTQITRFDKPVKAQQHQAAHISGNKKAVLLKLKATDIINGNASIANTITLNN